MKWYKKEKHYENYKGEKFMGKMVKDLEVGDQYEAEAGKFQTVQKKTETKDYLAIEVIFNG